MKWNHVAKSVVMALAVLIATSAFAASGNKGSLHLSEATQISGQSVPAGDYQLRWEGTGGNVEVSVMQGKKVVTKTSARVIEMQSASNNDAAVVDKSAGTPTVTEVRFAGKKYALALGAEKASMGESTK